MKKVISFLVLFLLALCLGAEETVSIAINPSPYYAASSSEMRGMYKMIYEESFAAVGYDVEFVVTPLQRGIQMFFQNQVDAHSPGSLYIRGELAEKILSVPTGRIVPIYVYYKPNGVETDIPETGLADRIAYFKEKNLGIIISRTSPVLGLFRSEGIRLIETETAEQQIRLLKSGRFDLAMSDYLIASLTVREIFPDDMDDFGYITVPPWDISLAFLKGNLRSEELYARFSAGMDELIRSGRYLEIQELYWGKGNVPSIVLPDELAPFGIDRINLSGMPSIP